MDEQTKRAKITRFLADKSMNQAVYDSLLRTFIATDKTADVHKLAASRLAIDLLQKAWADLLKYKSDADEDTQSSANVGL